jgi:hypothetical protein
MVCFFLFRYLTQDQLVTEKWDIPVISYTPLSIFRLFISALLYSLNNIGIIYYSVPPTYK